MYISGGDTGRHQKNSMMSRKKWVAGTALAGATVGLPTASARGVCINRNHELNAAYGKIHTLEKEKNELVAQLTQKTCEPGKHYDTTKYGCAECPENQFRASGMGDCMSCSNGMVSDAGSPFCRYDLHGQSEYLCGPNTVVANDPTGMLGNCRVADPRKGEFSLGYTNNLEFSRCGQAGDGYDFAKMNSKESPCTPCGPGTYSKDGFCAPCDIHHYQDQSGQGECKPCSMPGSLASITGGAQTCSVSQRVQNAVKYGENSWGEKFANLAISDESHGHMHPDVQNAMYDKIMANELIKAEYHTKAFDANPHYRKEHLRYLSDEAEKSRRHRGV